MGGTGLLSPDPESPRSAVHLITLVFNFSLYAVYLGVLAVCVCLSVYNVHAWCL